MIEIEQGTGKYVTIAADEETALRWSGDIGFKMMQYNQIRGVLPISQQYIDERLHVYYEVNKNANAGIGVCRSRLICGQGVEGSCFHCCRQYRGQSSIFYSAEQFVLKNKWYF